jgi:hypothetical protein
VPARSGGRKVVVENLRDQAVEIHHGADVVVVPPFEQVELPDVRVGGDHLAELARQELVSVQPVKPAAGAAGSTRRRTRSARSRSTGASGRGSGRKTKPPKPPEGGS